MWLLVNKFDTDKQWGEEVEFYELGLSPDNFLVLSAEHNRGLNDLHERLYNFALDFDKKEGQILGMGTRIIPMSQDILGRFDSGQTISQTAERTKYRGTRRLYQRDNLRRERLHRVLNVLKFLPKHYGEKIDFEFRKGQFIDYSEPKIPFFTNAEGKYEFLFKPSFNEMVSEFKEVHPELFENGKKIPYDWTIYYLRKKALKQKITKEELSWLILNFNQKRGYYQLSEENEEIEDGKSKEFVELKVKQVVDSGKDVKGKKLYDIFFENDWKYDKQVTKTEDWINQTKEFIVTESKLKSGDLKRTFKAVNSEDDWIAIKKKTEQQIETSKNYVGVYIYEALLFNPSQKIRGKLVKTIERKFYKKEFEEILKTQIKHHPELNNKELYSKCIFELYPNNEAHQRNIKDRDFLYLFKDDIIFYQRPLKIKTHLISNCSFEYRIRRDNKEKVYLKCIPKSNPLFQEFRLWQFITNLKVYRKEKEVNGKIHFDVDETNDFLQSIEDRVSLFEWLNDREKISQKQLLNFFKLNEDSYRWNYVQEKEYPCNETRADFIKALKKTKNISKGHLTNELTKKLWHILYSVTDPEERRKAITKFAQTNDFNESFVELFSKFSPYKRDYGSYSEKAIKKLLSLMRMGKDYSWNKVHKQTKARIEKLLTGEFDKSIRDRVREKSINLQKEEDFQGLPLWLASYVVYDRHSEISDNSIWNSSQAIADYLNPKMKNSFKQHSLRNPIVEQVLTETLRVVKDIWDFYGNGKKDFFDEIHIELGRSMKNDKKTREKLSKRINKNENTNERIKALLQELKDEGQNVKPFSPSQQEILKIYEEGVYDSEKRKEEIETVDIIRKNPSPSKKDIQRYKLWLEQGYISPYTGFPIMLSHLFTHRYQIEHIIPQSRYFDDSLSNKIICESEVNELKDNLTAFEFILKYGGSIVSLGEGRKVKIFEKEDYEQHVNSYFSNNRIKKERLLTDEIPESFIERQMNDTRYISKTVKNLLSKIVREEDEQETTSKNIVVLPGSITSKLKHQWGLNDIWNTLITPRFRRMNELTNSEDYGSINPNTSKFLPKVPDEISKGFSKKRIDHRHHALDALVIACTSKDHVNYLTSLNTERENYKLIDKLRETKFIQKEKTLPNGEKKLIKKRVAKNYLKPWSTFTQDALAELESTVISFKQNLRVINKATNKYEKWCDKNGEKKKRLVKQEGTNWAVRKPMHKEFVYGKVNLPFVKIPKGKSITAIREEIDTTFNSKRIASITDRSIQKILINHLESFDERIVQFESQTTTQKIEKRIELIKNKSLKEHPELAFSPKGLDDMNNKLKEYNEGKSHQPIYKARIFEIGSRFPVGENGSKKDKFVEAAKGTNLFFAVYWNDEKQKRDFETIPLYEVIEHQKQTAHLPEKEKTLVPINKEKGEFLFSLSPNDLVYVPLNNEDFKNNEIDKKNIYKCVSFSNKQVFFVKHEVAKVIHDKKEYSALNKMEKDIYGTMIKEKCWIIKVDLLGRVLSIIK
jgi:CRISPR-associated endonuclease Csn1